MRKKHILLEILLAVGLIAGSGGCKSKERKEIAELQARLNKEASGHSGCKDKVSQLNERIMRLENTLKKIKDQPCEYELDPVTFEIKQQAPDPRTPNARTIPARPAPGPPLQVSLVTGKVRESRNQLKQCYVEALKRSSKLQAEPIWVRLQFTLYNSGSVGAIRLSPFIGAGFEPCIKRVVRTWKFPRFGGFPKPFVQRIRLTPR